MKKQIKRGDVIHMDGGEIRYYRRQDFCKAFVTTPYDCKIRVISFLDDDWARVRITIVPESIFVFDKQLNLSFLAYMERGALSSYAS